MCLSDSSTSECFQNILYYIIQIQTNVNCNSVEKNISNIHRIVPPDVGLKYIENNNCFN